MKKIKVFCAAVMLSWVSSGVFAQSELYTEATYWQLASTSRASASGNTSSDGQTAAAIVGYQWTENLSVEGMLGTGLSNADVKLNGASQSPPVTSKLNSAFGVFVRAKTALTSDLEVFARAGRNGWQTTSSTSSASVSSNLYDWMYSAGLNYNINKSTYLTGSWATLYDKGSTKVDGWSVGVGYRF